MINLVHKKTIDCIQGAVRAVRYNVDGSYCLTCGSDKKLKLWNPQSGLLLKTYGGHGNEVTDAAGSCDSCFIVTSSLDKSIIYWDVTTAVPVQRLREHAGGVNCVKFNEDSSIAVSGSKDNTVMCWDIRRKKKEPIQIMKDAKDCITSLIVSEYQILASSLDGSIRTYDIRAGQMTCDTIGEPITSIVQTKDGQCVLASCMDNSIRLIDSDTGDMLSEYKGHRTDDYHIECGIINNDSKIISGTTEGLIYIWDLVDGTIVKKLLIDSHNVVHSLSTHPSTSDIIFAKKREIQLWGQSEFEEIEII